MQALVTYVVPLLVVSTSSQLLQRFPADFQPILSKIIAQKDKVKIAKATDTLEIKGHKAIARVIKHTNADSPVARTVIIQNSPEAHRAFGVRNAPKKSFFKSQKKILTGTTTPLNNSSFPVKDTNIYVDKNTNALENTDVKENAIIVKHENTPVSTTGVSKTAPTIVSDLPTAIIELPYSNTDSIETNHKTQEILKTSTDVPRQIRSYTTSKTVGTIRPNHAVKKHVIETSEQQQDKHAIVQHQQTRNSNFGHSANAGVIDNFTNYKDASVQSEVRHITGTKFQTKSKSKFEIRKNQTAFVKTLPQQNTSTTSQTVKYQEKNKRKRHIWSPRQSNHFKPAIRESRNARSNYFRPPSRFFYGFRPVAQPKYHFYPARGNFRDIQKK